MSAELTPKRGRPKKVVVVSDDVPVLPKETLYKATKKTSVKAATKTPDSKSNANSAKAKAKPSTPIPISPEPLEKTTALPKGASGPPAKSKVPVSKAASESIILQELAALDASKQSKRLPESPEKARSVKIAIELPKKATLEVEPEALLPSTTPLQIPTITIPTQQASTMPPNVPISLLYTHNPNASILQQAAYMSTKSTKAQSDTPKASRRDGPPRALPLKNYMSPKEFNKFAVEELSSRRGPGAGAESTREAQTKAEAPKPGKPITYKSTARRVTAIMCALPIVIVTSYYLYQRLFLGMEPKQFPRLPTTISPRPAPSPKESEPTK